MEVEVLAAFQMPPTYTNKKKLTKAAIKDWWKSGVVEGQLEHNRSFTNPYSARITLSHSFPSTAFQVSMEVEVLAAFQMPPISPILACLASLDRLRQ